jgi:chromosome segregation ATPase
LTHRLDTLHEDVGEVKSALKELANAITKLALIEERQTQAATAQERAFGAIERIEKRVAKLEMQAPANKRVSVWVDRAMYASAGLLVMFVLKKAGVM